MRGVLCLLILLAAGAWASSVSFSSQPHRLLSQAEFQDLAARQPHVTARAQDPNAVRDRSFYKSGSVIPMAGGYMTTGFYYVNISVAGQQFSMLLDTGSSNLAVPGVQCPTCGTDPNRYVPSQSPTAQIVPFDSPQCAQCSPDGSEKCPFGQPFPNEVFPEYCGYGVSYGGGSSFLGGYLVNDMVTFGEYTVLNTLVTMTGQYPNASFSSGPVDGIIGLAHELNACNPTWAPTILGEIFAKNPDLQDMFGLCLDPQNGGVIDIGFADSSKYTGELQWVPQVQERWYNMPLRTISVGTTPLAVPTYAFSYDNDQIGSFIDSGTSVILIAPLAFTSFTAIFQTQYASLPGVTGNSNLFNGACVSDAQMGNSLASFPTLYFEFSGEQSGSIVSLPVGPQSYLMHAQGQYCLGVAGVVGIGAVLGDVFMENFYIVHDRAGARIGFAPVSNCV